MTLTASTASNAASEIAAARQADHVAFLHRVPFAYDALRLGFLTGFREDCTYQQQQFNALELPVGMLDNDFRNPDLDRYVECFFEHEPQIEVIGDAYEVDEVDRYVAAAREIQGSYPESDLVIVPKCRAAIHAVPDDLVVGFSRGYADRLAHEFSEPHDWRGRRVHILGGSPSKQLGVIKQLTRPTLTGDPPADIVGLDWNGLHRGAQFGEFWTADGWDDSGRDAEHMTIRKTVRCSLAKLLVAWLRILESDAERGWAVVLEKVGYTLDEVKHVLDSEEYPTNMQAFKSELAALETVGGVAQRVFSQYDYDGAYADVLLTTMSRHSDRGSCSYLTRRR